MNARASLGTLSSIEPESSPFELADAYLAHIEAGGGDTPEDFLAGRGIESDEALELLRVVASVEEQSGRLPTDGDRIGPYDIGRRIGKGGMGVVYRAHDRRLDRPVALKVCRRAMMGDSAEQRFQREARALARLRHPHIVEVYDIGETEHLLYYAMELVEGPSLDDLIAKGPLTASPRDLARRFAELARALHRVHQEGLVHRDVKPANVLVASDTRFVLSDFGVAHWEQLHTLTGTQDLPGTPAYMAPEQFRGKSVSPAQDQYALGAVCYESLTGVWPQRQLPLREMLANGGVPRLSPLGELRPDADDIVSAIILRALAPDPSERFESLAAFASALEQYADSSRDEDVLVGVQLGPYRIESRLGSGGMGTVYRAVEADTGAALAVKVLHPHLSHGVGFVDALEREAEAGRRIIHPHVVRVHGASIERSQGRAHALIVMELVEGSTLRDLLTAQGPFPEALLRELARQAAAGLAAIHAAGLLHGDVKPDNLILDDEEVLRVMDLGVARPLGEREGALATSLRYAAPERFDAAPELTPASDLYALGATLYELATGRPPFEERGTAALIHAHVQAPVPRAEREQDPLSPFFQGLLQTLLAKAPGARLPDASTLVTVLEQGEGSAWWQGRGEAEGGGGVPRPRTGVRRDTPLVEREPQSRVLESAWSACRDEGRGGVVFVSGEAGVGKTRLVDALLRTERLRQEQVLYGAFRPGGGADGLAESVAGFFGQGHVATRVAPYVGGSPELVRFLTNLVVNGMAGDVDGRFQPESLATALKRMAVSLAERGPTLWILDGVERASRDARSAMMGLLAASTEAPVLVVLTGEGEVESGLPGVPADARVDRIGLDRLSFDGTQSVLSHLIGSAMASLAPRLQRASGGNPGLLIEIVDGLFERGLLVRGETGSVRIDGPLDDVTVPESVAAAVRQRIAALSSDQREILEVASVQGYRFEPDLVAEVLGLKRLRILQRLAEIERETGLIRNHARVVDFDTPRARDELYRGLTDDLRHECHTLLADAALERSRGAIDGPAALFQVEHRFRGRDAQAGLPYFEAAYDHLRERHELVQAATLARQAADAVGGPQTVDGLGYLIREIDAQHAVGLYREARERLDEGLAAEGEHHRAVERASLRRLLGAAHRHSGHAREAVEHLGHALALAEVSADTREEGKIRSLLGAVTLQVGDMAGAEAHFQRALDLAEAHGDVVSQWISLNNLGNVSRHNGRIREALHRYDRAIELATQTRPGFMPWLLPMTRARALIRMGRCAEAREVAEAGLRRAVEANDPRLTSTAIEILASIRLLQGDTHEAIEGYTELLRQQLDSGSTYLAAYALLSLAEVHGDRGDREQQVACLERARSFAQEFETAPLNVIIRCLLAAAGAEDLGAAEQDLIELLPRFGLMERLQLHWRLHQATGKVEHLRAAKADLTELLEGIGPPENADVVRTDPTLRLVQEAPDPEPS